MESDHQSMTHVESDQKIEFEPGSEAIYGLHGKVSIESIEKRQIGGESLMFYKLIPSKNTPAKSRKDTAAIWLPLSTAKTKGLRARGEAPDIEVVFALLSNAEYYFSLEAPWKEIHPQLEAVILKDGFFGLAKVVGYLWILSKQHVVLPTEISKFKTTVEKIFFREIAEITGETMKTVESQVQKALKQKEALDH